MDLSRELPGLDEVEVGIRAGRVLPLIGYYLAMAAFAVVAVVHGCIRYWSELGDDRALVLSAVMLVAGLFGWIVVRLALWDFAWKTDRYGLSARGLLRRRFVAWEEVRGAKTVLLGGTPWQYRLETDRGVFRFECTGHLRGKHHDAAHLIASIRQHLHRRQRAGGIQLPPGADSLWDEIPVPSGPITWRAPRDIGPSPGGQVAAIGFVLLLGVGYVAFAFWMLITEGGSWFAAAIGLLMGGSLVGMVVWGLAELPRVWRSRVLQCELTPKGLRAERSNGAVFWSWPEITRAEWVPTGRATALSLRLAAACRGESMLLTGWSEDAETACFFLALIGALRFADPPILLWIPPVLRCYSSKASVCQPVTERGADHQFRRDG